MSILKKILFISIFWSMTSLANSVTGAGSAAGSAASVLFPEELVGSVVSVFYSGMAASIAAGSLAATVSEITAEGKEWVVASVKSVGDKVQITIEASGAVMQSGVEVSEEVVKTGSTASRELTKFTFELSRSAFAASEEVFETVISKIVGSAIKAAPIIVGSAGVVLGCTLTLVSAPGVIIGVILTEAGRELHAS